MMLVSDHRWTLRYTVYPDVVPSHQAPDLTLSPGRTHEVVVAPVAIIVSSTFFRELGGVTHAGFGCLSYQLLSLP